MTGETAGTGSIRLQCPRCRASMIRRRNRMDGSEFWGCPNFPRCRGKRELQAPSTVRHDEHATSALGQIHSDDPNWRRQSAAGASARASFERRTKRHSERVRDCRPRTLLRGAAIVAVGFGLTSVGPSWAFAGWALIAVGVLSTLAALFLAPGHVRAWEIGAGGEERIAELLGPLENAGFFVLHDRRIPGARENIDHLLVGPPGVFVVETKNYDGAVCVRGGELYVGGRRKTGFLHQVDRQVAAIERALEVEGVRAFICALRGDFPIFGRPSARGINIVPPMALVATLRSLPALLDDAEIDRLARLAEQRLRPAGQETSSRPRSISRELGTRQLPRRSRQRYKALIMCGRRVLLFGRGEHQDRSRTPGRWRSTTGAGAGAGRSSRSPTRGMPTT
jgi:hypothetical protein